MWESGEDNIGQYSASWLNSLLIFFVFDVAYWNDNKIRVDDGMYNCVTEYFEKEIEI